MEDIDLIRVLVFAIIGAVTGSFLTVVATRGPIAWGLIDSPPGTPDRYGLDRPRSHCPHCRARLTARDLVPIVSYLIQRGRCRTCDTAIGTHYIALEAITIAAALVCALIPSPAEGWAVFAALATLIALSDIDCRTGFLPDALTLPLALGGLAAAAAGLTVPPSLSIWGLLAGAIGFWALGAGFQALRGREGLGGGDTKLLAAAGAWVGPFALPWVVLIAALTALAGVAISALGGKATDRETEIRFGPYLSAGTAAMVLAPHVAQMVRSLA